MSNRDGGEVAEASAEARKVESSVEEKMRIIIGDSTIWNSEPNIIKVPSDIRNEHDKAYEPKMFTIGPYHRKEDNSCPMEQIKIFYLNDLLSRDKKHNKVCRYADAILKDEKKARQQYSDHVGLLSEEFVEMLVIDGCFIVEFLLKRAEGKANPYFSGQLRNMPILRRDLLLLENQIPFFILKTILQNSKYNLQRYPRGTTIIDLALDYLSKGKVTKDMLSKYYRDEENIYHLLHLSYLSLLQGLSPLPRPPETPTHCNSPYMRKIISSSTFFLKRSVRLIKHWVYLFNIFLLYFVFRAIFLLVLWRSPNWSISKEKTTSKKPPRVLPTATELKEAGVTFKKKKNKDNPNFSYLDVSFNREGYLQIPFLSIQENTESTFRNFLALEQSCPHVGNYLTSYVVLIDNLIDTSSDVSILMNEGILESKLGCNVDVAKLFNQMRSGLYFDFDNHYLVDTFQDVRDYCNLEHNRWRGKLIHDYFCNPWACVSIITAALLLVLTAVQTIYTVKGFYNDN